jgi:hypothetical protein
MQGQESLERLAEVFVPVTEKMRKREKGLPIFIFLWSGHYLL